MRKTLQWSTDQADMYNAECSRCDGTIISLCVDGEPELFHGGHEARLYCHCCRSFDGGSTTVDLDPSWDVPAAFRALELTGDDHFRSA